MTLVLVSEAMETHFPLRFTLELVFTDSENINNTNDLAETNAIIDNIATDLLKQENIVETPNIHPNTLWDLELEKENKDALKGKLLGISLTSRFFSVLTAHLSIFSSAFPVQKRSESKKRNVEDVVVAANCPSTCR